MTHGIVQSDIEIAERLLEAGCEESGIIAWLCWRGVGTEQAARLVESLRKGELVTPELPLTPGTYRDISSTSLPRRLHGSRIACRRVRLTHRPRRCHLRRKRLRLGRKLMRWAAGILASAGVAWCLGYVSYCTWGGLMALREYQDPYTWDHKWEQDLNRSRAGLQYPGLGDLGSLPVPRPSVPSAGLGLEPR
jgi:hypothetical protein